MATLSPSERTGSRSVHNVHGDTQLKSHATAVVVPSPNSFGTNRGKTLSASTTQPASETGCVLQADTLKHAE